MKWFLERKRMASLSDSAAGKSGVKVGFGVIALSAMTLTASASLVAWQSPGLLLGAGNGLSRWLENAEAGSGVEKALYRLMKLPGGEAL